MKPTNRQRFLRLIGYCFGTIAVATALIIVANSALFGERPEGWDHHIALLRLIVLCLSSIASLMFYREARS